MKLKRDKVRREAIHVAPGLSDLLREEILYESKERAGILITNGFGEGISPFQMTTLLESHIEGS